MKKAQSFQQIVLKLLDVYVQKNLNTKLLLYIKINTKWTTDLIAQCKL